MVCFGSVVSLRGPLMGDGALVDDFDHPIRQVEVVDVKSDLAGGGAYYGLVIASPLFGDDRSQKRLLSKIEAYIGDFHSEQSIGRNGRPTPERCKIVVGIHPGSAAVVFELLERCRPWALEHGIELSVTTDIGIVTRQ
jgi:hypothetical protein